MSINPQSEREKPCQVFNTAFHVLCAVLLDPDGVIREPSGGSPNGNNYTAASMDKHIQSQSFVERGGEIIYVFR